MATNSAGLTDEVQVELNPADPGPTLPPPVDEQGDEDCDVSVQCDAAP